MENVLILLLYIIIFIIKKKYLKKIGIVTVLWAALNCGWDCDSTFLWMLKTNAQDNAHKNVCVGPCLHLAIFFMNSYNFSSENSISSLKAFYFKSPTY